MLFTPRVLLLPVSLFAVTLLSACGLIGDDEDDPNGATSVRVLQAVMSTEITPEQQATGYATRAFPEGTSRVYAVLALQGAEIGDEMTGRWYQLSTDAAEPEGTFVNEGSVVLTNDNLAQDGTARVSFNLAHNTGTLPNGDWVLRVYADGELIRTMGFVISGFVTLPAAQGNGGSAPSPTPAAQQAQPTPTAGAGQPQPTPTQAQQAQPTPTQASAPQTYTVVSGDTLTIIAERFKGPNESTEAYVTRLQQANNLTPGSILFIGQVLTLPPPP